MSDEAVTTKDIATPLRPIGSINTIVEKMFRINKPVGSKDIFEIAQMARSNAGKALSAAKDLTLTESSGKKGYYRLTTRGTDYARLISAKKEDEAKILLHKLILEAPSYEYIITYLKGTYNEPIDAIDLILSVERNLGKSYSNSMRNAVSSSLTSILAFCDIIRYESGKIVSLLSIEEDNKNIEEKEDESLEDDTNELGSALKGERCTLKTNDFMFSVADDVSIMQFAKAQFLAWIDFLISQKEKAE